MKKVVFIDWNKTLSFDLFWGHLKDINHPNHHYLEPIEKWLFVDNRNLIHLWMRGDIILDEITSRMSSDTGILPEIIIKELRHSCETMRFCIADVERLIRAIQDKGILVVVATDNMDTFTKFTVPALGLESIFDDILSSHVIKHLKDEVNPKDSILFFDNFLEKHNLNYSDAVLLDDSPDSSGKYKRLGFERVLIDKPDTLQRTLEVFAYGK